MEPRPTSRAIPLRVLPIPSFTELMISVKGMPAISPMATAPTRMEIIACTLNLMIKSSRITNPAKAAIISLVGSRAAAVVVVILITLL